MNRPAIGVLKHRLVLEAPGGTPDDAGGVAVAWTTAATVWAAVRTLGLREAMTAAAALDGAATHRITLRAGGTVESGMRFRAGARTFRVLAVERAAHGGRFTECLCEEGGT
jgi:SPP1 family predicted phage head-tail adaptor